MTGGSIGALVHTPVFYLSCAEEDEAGGYLRTFFCDLVDDVHPHSTVSLQRVGFRRRWSLAGGDLCPGMERYTSEEEDPLLSTPEALATCRVLVPVYSPSYFSDRDCGREWTAFESRCQLHRDVLGGATPIVPVLWVRKRDRWIPPCAAALQWDGRGLPAEYTQHGLRELIKYERGPAGRAVAERTVQEFLRGFVALLVERALEVEGGYFGALEDLDGLPDAFEPPASPQYRGRREPRP